MPDLPRILHVEDDPDIREITLIALETVGGYSVVQCASGAEALTKVVEIAPELFLLDVMMPGMSGEETLSALRAIPQFAQTPAIFMTAKAQESEIGKLMAIGAIAVITKPFDPMALGDDIARILATAPQKIVSQRMV